MALERSYRKKIEEHFSQDLLFFNEPLAHHTSFKIGGPADLLFVPKQLDELMTMIKLCKDGDIPYEIIGKGSNLLVTDKGVRGVVIKLSDFNLKVEIDGHKVVAGSGMSVTLLASMLQQRGLSGLEFAYGIPGTLGGCVVMNAGAYGGEMQDVVRSVRVLTTDGKLLKIEGESLEFSYRKSVFQKKDWLLVDVEMEMTVGSPEDIRGRMEDYLFRRQDKQPLSYPSAGSTFKRPPGYYAGALIDQAGLKGKQVGNAQVSTKHAGFIINLGGATADDVLNLMSLVQTRVKDRFHVDLVPEVRVIGER